MLKEGSLIYIKAILGKRNTSKKKKFDLALTSLENTCMPMPYIGNN